MNKPQYGEPWAYASLHNAILREQGSVVAGNSPDNALYDTDAKRIVACVNACAGLSDEDLKAVPQSVTLSDAVKSIVRRHDEQSRRYNFAKCGCDVCSVVRPILAKADERRER